MRLKIYTFCILLLAISLQSYSQYSIAGSGVRKIMEEHPVAGMSVAVVKGGKIVYMQSFGYRDLENKDSLTNESIFRIASVSKSFTVTALMQLMEKKKLGLKDDVSDLIGFRVRNPRYPNTIITLEMLLSHTSGLNDSEGYFSLDTVDPAKNANWKNCYNDYEPGKGYDYCNLNFNIAGAILEKVSGQRFDHYVAENILHPLGIDGGYNVNDLDTSTFAKIYEYNTDSGRFYHMPAAYAPRTGEISNYVMGYTTPVFSPTGGLKVSASGLSRYMLMHMNKGKMGGRRIISARSEGLMRKPRSNKENYGLGLLTTTKLIAGEELIGHTGNAYGLFSAMFFEPKKKFGIVVISNGCDPGYTGDYNTVIFETINLLYKAVVIK